MVHDGGRSGLSPCQTVFDRAGAGGRSRGDARRAGRASVTMAVYEELSDDQFKWFLLPAAEAREGLARADRQMQAAFAASREIIPIARFFLPAILAAKQAEIRSEWTFAMLRIFEAMRLYAATHDGQWPERSSDITDVPIPVNPVDGKPFVYQRQGNKAILTSEKGPKNVPWHHEITLMPKAK